MFEGMGGQRLRALLYCGRGRITAAANVFVVAAIEAVLVRAAFEIQPGYSATHESSSLTNRFHSC